MCAEKNVDIVCIKDLFSHAMHVHFFSFHIWAEWQSLHEKHGILKFLNIWMLLIFPGNSDFLHESSWNETIVRTYLNSNIRRSIYEKGNWNTNAWVSNSKTSNKSTLNFLKAKFFFIISCRNINKM